MEIFKPIMLSRHSLAVPAILGCLALSACGGGGSGNPAAAQAATAGTLADRSSSDTQSGDNSSKHRSNNHAFSIEEAKWDHEKHRLTVKGKGSNDRTVTVSNADTGSVVGKDTVNDDKWKVRERNPDSIPCRVRAVQADGQSADKTVKDAPSNCDDGNGQPPATGNQAPVLAPIGNKSVVKGNNLTFTVSATDDGQPDGILTLTASQLPSGASFTDNGNGSGTFNWNNASPAGTVQITFTASDGVLSNSSTITITVTTSTTPPPTTGGTKSINSTSQSGMLKLNSVSELPQTGLSGYSIFAINDLGMHCGDFDTRVSSILPPFNILHAQVISRGATPKILSRASGTSVSYSAASNPLDPILLGKSPSGLPLRLSVTNGKVFKTNFWDTASGSTESIALKAYRPFYPPGILDAFAPVPDQGLPMPNVERLYLGDGTLTADQAFMPGVVAPYMTNDAEDFKGYVTNLPFFINFPFGYTSSKVNWYEAVGVSATAFDDAGRENPYPLFRVQAKDAGGTVLASVDTVAPISGEANCQGCHGAPVDGGNGAATRNMTNLATTLDDPKLGQVPLVVSKEYASDINILRLHDQKHGTFLENSTPVVCQTCHYTPALDLAQVGPRGPENDTSPGNPSNGRDQVKNKSMSNVMHSHHATVTDANGKALFPAMPPPIDANGKPRDPVLASKIVNETCYQCHPGRRTSCLRGAMGSSGIVCQDCHGDMAEVGNDFTRNVSASNPGAFELASDFYTNPATPRVPWANVPTCGSCHTGDAMNNMHSNTRTVGSSDGIRLLQAWLKGDPKATPIVPTNKRFAEPAVAATGNPQLYRVSTGHGGVQCESCHGATHAIWPNGNPNANDNVAANQLQGHAGVISECSTCHTGDLGINLDGPHGIHPVGTAGARFADGGHDDLAERNPNACRACHGQNGQGTDLSVMHVDRVLKCDKSTAFCPNGNSVLFPKGHQVTCSDCHSNKL